MTTEQDKKWILTDFIKDTLGLEKTSVLRGLDYKVLQDLCIRIILEENIEFTTEGE